jgi:hypothetical protein
MMTLLSARFCVGCGQVLDELQLSDNRHCWINAHVYCERYGYRFNELHLIEDTCPPCARVLAIGRREAAA